MLNSKCLPTNSSSSAAHQMLTSQGFRKIVSNERELYQLRCKDSSTQMNYHFHIPIKINRHEEGKVTFGREYFSGVHIVPKTIHEAVESKLQEIADYLNMMKKTTAKKRKNGQASHI